MKLQRGFFYVTTTQHKIVVTELFEKSLTPYAYKMKHIIKRKKPPKPFVDHVMLAHQ
jgi:hypothetical protein